MTIDPFASDLNFIRDILIQDHPGVHDRLNPDFCLSLETNFDKAKQELSVALDALSKMKIIENFGRSFEDNHLYALYKKLIPAHVLEKKQVLFTIEKINHIYWLRLPTFCFHKESALAKSFEMVIETIKGLKGHPFVIDVRGNGGGTSEYGIQVLKALFDDTDVEQKLSQLNSAVSIE